ncbi:hypothetical protein ACVHNB_18960 [Streptomyces sp. YJ-C3]
MATTTQLVRSEVESITPDVPRLVWKYAHHSPTGGSFTAQHRLTHLQVVWHGAPDGVVVRAESEGLWTPWVRLPGLVPTGGSRGDGDYFGLIALPLSERYELRVPRGMSVVRIVELCLDLDPASAVRPQPVKGFRFPEGQSIRSDFVSRAQWAAGAELDLRDSGQPGSHPQVIALQHVCAEDLLEGSADCESNAWLNMSALARCCSDIRGRDELPWHYLIDAQGCIWQGKAPAPCAAPGRISPPDDEVIMLGVLGGRDSDPLAGARAGQVTAWLLALLAGTCGIPPNTNLGTASRWLPVAADPALSSHLPLLRRQVQNLLC